MIKFQSYSLNNIILTNEVLTAYINNFWNDIFTNLLQNSKKVHLMLMIKVVYNDPEIGTRTIGQLRRVNYSDNDFFIINTPRITKKINIHLETMGGIRTIGATGCFRMRINSPEFFNALKDYNFKVNY